MRTKYNLARIKDFWKVNVNRTKPEPFPGPHPLRWRLIYHQGSKLLFNYWGKPNPLLIKKITRLAKNTKGTLFFAECDRGGAIRTFLHDAPWNPPFNVNYNNATLVYNYYPWSPVRDFFGPWRNSCYSKFMVPKKGRPFFIYSPEVAQNKQVIATEDYFQWHERNETQKLSYKLKF